MPKGEAPSNCKVPRLIEIQKCNGVCLRSARKPVGYAARIEESSGDNSARVDAKSERACGIRHIECRDCAGTSSHESLQNADGVTVVSRHHPGRVDGARHVGQRGQIVEQLVALVEQVVGVLSGGLSGGDRLVQLRDLAGVVVS